MAKSKNKKKSNSSLDTKYNELIRKISIKSFESTVSRCLNKYDIDLIEEVFYHIKNIYYEIDKDGCDEYIDTIFFMELLNCVEDYFLLATTGKYNIKEENKVIRDIFVKKLMDKNIKFELLVYTSKIGFLYEFPELYPNDVDVLYLDIAKLITDAVYIYSQYITTYICKFKNYEISAFDYDGEHINIKYSTIPSLLKEHIDFLNQCVCVGVPSDKQDVFEKYLTKITKQIHTAYSNFMTRDIDSEYQSEYKGYLSIERLYLLPFYNEDGFIIDDEELSKIPHNRRYATHSSGIRFEFLNKEYNIDYIDMKENEKHFNFNVFIINNGGISVSWHDDTVEDKHRTLLTNKELIKSKLIKLSFVIYKEQLINASNMLEKEDCVKCLGYLPSTNTDDCSSIFFIQMRKILLACIYLAYYNPLLLKKEVTLYNRIIDKKTGYTRKSGFRIAHLKKLPTGYRASEDALKNAKKEGFDSIPEGYTFVRASNLNPENKPDKKVIKIDL